MRIDELFADGDHRDGILTVAVGDVVVVVLYGDVAKVELLLCFDRSIMDSDELFQKALQGSFVGAWRLDGILQIG